MESREARAIRLAGIDSIRKIVPNFSPNKVRFDSLPQSLRDAVLRDEAAELAAAEETPAVEASQDLLLPPKPKRKKKE